MKQLIKLSEDKGFVGENNFTDPFLNFTYLWMCRVQQWLRKEHGCVIVILPFLLEDGSVTYEYTNYSTQVDEELDHGDGPFEIYEEALKAALISALKQI
jgi:hypothetical protein